MANITSAHPSGNTDHNKCTHCNYSPLFSRRIICIMYIYKWLFASIAYFAGRFNFARIVSFSNIAQNHKKLLSSNFATPIASRWFFTIFSYNFSLALEWWFFIFTFFFNKISFTLYSKVLDKKNEENKQYSISFSRHRGVFDDSTESDLAVSLHCYPSQRHNSAVPMYLLFWLFVPSTRLYLTFHCQSKQWIICLHLQKENSWQVQIDGPFDEKNRMLKSHEILSKTT